MTPHAPPPSPKSNVCTAHGVDWCEVCLTDAACQSVPRVTFSTVTDVSQTPPTSGNLATMGIGAWSMPVSEPLPDTTALARLQLDLDHARSMQSAAETDQERSYWRGYGDGVYFARQIVAQETT